MVPLRNVCPLGVGLVLITAGATKLITFTIELDATLS